jgi:hypothetical protein
MVAACNLGVQQKMSDVLSPKRVCVITQPARG